MTAARSASLAWLAPEALYSFKDHDSPPSSKVKDGHEDIDGDVQLEANHPHIYVKAEGHAVYGDLRWERKGFPGEDGVVYRFTEQAEEPQDGNDRDVGNDPLHIDDLWAKRHDPDVFCGSGTFCGDDHGENKANAPWGWDDKDDGEVNGDDFFIDPAYLVDYYHDGLGDFSHDYVFQFRN